MRRISVVGAVILKGGRVLAAQRGEGGTLPGLWEFPGGKIESGETPQSALEREIVEELSCAVSVGKEVVTTTHLYDFGEVTLTTFYCRLLAGEPQLTEHASMRWLLPTELDDVEWAPADLPAVAQIRADVA